MRTLGSYFYNANAEFHSDIAIMKSDVKLVYVIVVVILWQPSNELIRNVANITKSNDKRWE